MFEIRVVRQIWLPLIFICSQIKENFGSNEAVEAAVDRYFGALSVSHFKNENCLLVIRWTKRFHY